MFQTAITIFVSTLIAQSSPEDVNVFAPLSAPIVLHARPSSQGLAVVDCPTACEDFISRMRRFDIIGASRFADRLRSDTDQPEDQLFGFAYALRTQEWREAVNSDGSKREAALKILEWAKELRIKADGAGPLSARELDNQVAEVDKSISNAYARIVCITSFKQNTELSQAIEDLEEARPWYWWNNSRLECEAGRTIAAAHRLRHLVDLRTESRIEEGISIAVGGIEKANRPHYQKITGLSGDKPIHLELIPNEARPWDSRETTLLPTVDGTFDWPERLSSFQEVYN